MTTHNGYFWDPDQPEVKHFGMVEIDEGENILQLTIHGLLENIKPALYNPNFHNDIPLIHGKISQVIYISIYNLRVKHFVGGVLEPVHSALDTTVKLSFKFAIRGMKLFGSDHLFNSIYIVPQFGQQWTKESRVQKNYKSKPQDIKSEYKVTDLITDSFSTDFGQVKSSLYVQEKYKLLDGTVNIKEYLNLLFDLNTPLTPIGIRVFLQDFNRFYVLSIGQKLGLTSVQLKEKNEEEQYTFVMASNPLSKSSSAAGPDNTIVSYTEFVNGNFLDSFFKNKAIYALPLDYYFSYLHGGNQGDTSIYFILFLSALEVIHNKSYKSENNEKSTKNSREFERILNKVTSYLSSKEIQFLTKSKYSKSLKDQTIKDKLIDLIETSTKLQKLVEDKEQFAEEIKSIRHYLIHEETKNDLEFISNTQGLRKRVVQLKIILEYHLLVALGLDMEQVEQKIDKTMTNFMHFVR